MHRIDDSHPEELSIDAPGADEVAVVPWPLLLRERVVERVAGSPKYPWIVLTVAALGLVCACFVRSSHRREEDAPQGALRRDAEPVSA